MEDCDGSLWWSKNEFTIDKKYHKYEKHSLSNYPLTSLIPTIINRSRFDPVY